MGWSGRGQPPRRLRSQLHERLFYGIKSWHSHRSGNYHKVHTGRQIVLRESECLAEEALVAVSHHRAAEFFRDGAAKS